jgi:heme/copper-type cytochrome/quinol oxidase subunit 2
MILKLTIVMLYTKVVITIMTIAVVTIIFVVVIVMMIISVSRFRKDRSNRNYLVTGLTHRFDLKG